MSATTCSGFGPFVALLEKNKDLARLHLPPLITLAIAGADVSTLEKVYQLCPSAASPNNLFAAVEFVADKAALIYLANKLQDGKLDFSYFLKALQMRVDEDLLTLFAHHKLPRYLTLYSIKEVLPFRLDESMIECLAGKVRELTPNEFLELFQSIKDPIWICHIKKKMKKSILVLRGIDRAYISTMKYILPQLETIESFSNCWGYGGGRIKLTLTYEGLAEMAKLIFAENSNIRNIDLKFSSFTRFKKEGTMSKSDMILEMITSLQQQQQQQSQSAGKNKDKVQKTWGYCCRVEKVKLVFEEITRICDMSFLVGLTYLSCLCDLTLDISDSPRYPAHHQTIVSILVNLLGTSSSLRSLKLDGDVFCTAANNCIPIIDVLRHNSHLKSFDLGKLDRGDMGISAGKEIEDRMEQVLQQDNATLTSFVLRVSTGYGESEPIRSCLQQDGDGNGGNLTNLDYYIALNEGGRGLIRNHDMTLAEFVQRLSAADFSNDVKSRKQKAIVKENATKIQYGLLREMPELWCHIALKRGADRRRLPGKFYKNRKRKRTTKSTSSSSSSYSNKKGVPS